MTNIIHYFFPHLKHTEIKKFSLLGITAFFIIGAYWLLRLLKNTIFFRVAFPASLGWDEQQGALLQPIAKLWSPVVVLVVLLIYSKLIDSVKKHQLFYIICSFYGILFALIGILLCIKEWYGAAALGKDLLAAIGWISYFSIESFGSLAVALFWSFTNSITDSESAKEGFPLILCFAQMGGIVGSVVLLSSKSMGALWPLVILASILMFVVIGMIAYFMRVMPADQLIGNKAAAITEKKQDSFLYGFISGATLLVTRPYLIGVLIISTFYEIAMQIVEYQLHRQASICPTYSSETAFCWFEGMFGIAVNTLSFLMLLLGTAAIIKRLGLRLSLLLYPIIFALSLIALLLYFLYGSPTTLELLWTTFVVLMIIKGMSYAFNNPVKEMMYIPTSKDAKFKSKGWIDMFGGRFAKASGGRITNMFKYNLDDLMIYGTLFSFGLIGIWVAAALYVGIKNQKLIRNGHIIE